MYLTIDASALIAVIGNESSRQRIINMTGGYSLCAPPSVHWEIGNALSAMFKRHRLPLEKAQEALAVYREIPIKFVDVPLEKTLDLAHAQNMYAYDAYLLVCAQQTGTSLLTLDKGLLAIARKTGISVLEVMP